MFNFANILVIYIAIGVPFGVLTVTLVRGRAESSDFLRVIYALAFWPFFIVIPFSGRILNSLRGSIWVSDRRVTLNDSVNRFNVHVAGIEERDKRRKLIAKIGILNGLTEALSAARKAKQLRAPFLEIVTHPNPRLAARCLQRRNIARLERHLNAARENLERTIGAKCRSDLAFDGIGDVTFLTGIERGRPNDRNYDRLWPYS